MSVAASSPAASSPAACRSSSSAASAGAKPARRDERASRRRLVVRAASRASQIRWISVSGSPASIADRARDLAEQAREARDRPAEDPARRRAELALEAVDVVARRRDQQRLAVEGRSEGGCDLCPAAGTRRAGDNAQAQGVPLDPAAESIV